MHEQRVAKAYYKELGGSIVLYSLLLAAAKARRRIGMAPGGCRDYPRAPVAPQSA